MTTTFDSDSIQQARDLYAQMGVNVAMVRRRLQRALTLAEKLVLGHLVDPLTADLEVGVSTLRLRPDRVALQDVLGQTAFLQFAQTGRDRVAVPTTVHCDHLIQARVGVERDLPDSLAENGEVYDFLRSAAARYGAGFWEPGAGIIHQVVLENHAFPGALILGTDSHTPNASGLGACAVGVGGAEAVEAMAGLPWELLYPRRIAVVLSGQLSGWAAPKDIIVWVAGQLTVSGATNAIVEYIGPGARTLSATGKATIANMGAEMGATTSVFPMDSHMARYLEATGRGALGGLALEHAELLAPDPEVEAQPERYYDQVLHLDLSQLEPHVSGPHSPDRTRPISRLAGEVAGDSGLRDQIAVALIGSCTNSSYEDLWRAAAVARQAAQRGLRAAVPLYVTPGSERIKATVERDGLLDDLRRIGARVLANACGPCIGQWRRRDASDEPNTIVTSYNRNFPGRNDGQPTTMSFIASPEVVVAMALSGRLSFNPMLDALTSSDGVSFHLAAPGRAPEVPDRGFVATPATYAAPRDEAQSGELRVDPHSQRLQLLAPWPAWSGKDLLDMPVLMKTRGKTTTDQISPAGHWLRYRGHLDKFSDNFLLGAINAYSGARGVVSNVVGGEEATPAVVARAYRDHGIRWVVVGDSNYGEGSSREHAALSPRLLGGVAVIARSFARIHESNLKKQGMLALTFVDPDDYERLGEADRLSLLDLAELAPSRPVRCRVVGTAGERTIWLAHSYTRDQLAWFWAGSSLNVHHASSHFGS